MSTANLVRIVLLCISFLAVTSPSLKAAEPIDVGKQYKCQACHVNRLKEIKGGTEPALTTAEAVAFESYGNQDPSSTQRMCLSCHDGYVLDSRYVWSEEHSAHPVGVAAPAVVVNEKGKPVLPLNDDGEVYCGTCHLGHKGRAAAASAPTFIRTSRENGELCSNCHEEKTAIAGSPHARVKKTGQPPEFNSRGICGRCHAAHNNKGPLMWSKTPKSARGAAADGLCKTCHGKRPEYADHPAGVLAWSQPVREQLTGKTVVEMPVLDESGRHADRGAVGCATCHDPHLQRVEGLPEEVDGNFLRLADTSGFMCADCHKSSSLFRYKFYHSDKSR